MGTLQGILRIFRWGDYSGFSRGTQCSHKGLSKTGERIRVIEGVVTMKAKRRENERFKHTGLVHEGRSHELRNAGGI